MAEASVISLPDEHLLKPAGAQGGRTPGLSALGEPAAERGQTPILPLSSLDTADVPTVRRWWLVLARTLCGSHTFSSLTASSARWAGDIPGSHIQLQVLHLPCVDFQGLCLPTPLLAPSSSPGRRVTPWGSAARLHEGRTWHDPSPPPPPPRTPLLSLSKANSNQRNVCVAPRP